MGTWCLIPTFRSLSRRSGHCFAHTRVILGPLEPGEILPYSYSYLFKFTQKTVASLCCNCSKWLFRLPSHELTLSGKICMLHLPDCNKQVCWMLYISNNAVITKSTPQFIHPVPSRPAPLSGTYWNLRRSSFKLFKLALFSCKTWATCYVTSLSQRNYQIVVKILIRHCWNNDVNMAGASCVCVTKAGFLYAALNDQS